MKRRHVGVPNQSCGSLTLFLCKRFLLLQQICIDAGHVSENTLLQKPSEYCLLQLRFCIFCFNRLNMLQLTVQFIHLFAANLMFKGMILVPVILRMIYVITRIKDFFRATFFNQSKIKQKLIANCSPAFSRVKSWLHSLRNLFIYFFAI